MAERKAVRVVVRGRVQGIGYRWFVTRAARRAGVAGWVRNRADGAVELVAAGSAEAVAALLEAVRTGPPGARVEHVDTTPTVPDESFPDPFDIA